MYALLLLPYSGTMLIGCWLALVGTGWRWLAIRCCDPCCVHAVTDAVTGSGLQVRSPPIGWPAYLEGSGVPRDDLISILVGDLQVS